MATDPHVINDGVADKTYSLVSLNGSEAIYREEASELSTPMTLRISHQIAKNKNGVDRHLVQFSTVQEDTDDETTPYTGVAHVVITAPRKAVVEADLLKEWTKLSAFITANFSDVYGGFMP